MNRRLDKAKVSGATPKSGSDRASGARSGLSVARSTADRRERRRSTADERRSEGRFNDERTSSRKDARARSGVSPSDRPADVAAVRGVGGGGERRGGGGGSARGAPAYVFVGRVRNLGRGVWGFGSVVGWIPLGVWPWEFCRRKGWRQIFSRRTKPLVRSRPYVVGDDGRCHLAERWEEA